MYMYVRNLLVILLILAADVTAVAAADVTGDVTDDVVSAGTTTSRVTPGQHFKE